MKHITKILFSIVVLLSALYCTKQAEENAQSMPAHSLLERDGGDASGNPVPNTNANGDYVPYADAPLHTEYDGQCKLILKLAGSQPIVNSAQIVIKGYQAPSLLSTLLFTIPVTTISTNQWTTINIPQGANISFTLVSGNPGDRIQVKSQEYGFNKAGLVGGPVNGLFAYNSEQLILVNKFAPYTNDTKYICDSWCTWRVDYTCPGEIIPNQPRLKLISSWSSGLSVVTDEMRTYYFQQPTDGASQLVFPISSASSVNYYFQADSYPSNSPLPNFCYSITTLLAPNTPLITGTLGGALNINDVISNITFGTTPTLRSTSDCHIAPRSSNFPHCH